MLTFPTLSTNSGIAGHSETIAHDPTLRNETDSGYEIGRASCRERG